MPSLHLYLSVSGEIHTACLAVRCQSIYQHPVTSERPMLLQSAPVAFLINGYLHFQK